MANDKLPEDIIKQIEHEASKANEHLKEGNDYQAGYSRGIEDGYEQGATAWAQWKVRHDELHSELHETKQQADNLRIAYDELARKTQLMAEALEEIAESDCDYENINFKQRHSLECRACKAKELLQQFKEGGKEIKPVKEIEYMPIHPDDARKFDCPTQFPMHLLSDGRAQSNHGQTLKRLKERGGLSVREILAIVGNKGWNYYGGLQWPEAIKMLNDILTNPTK